MEFQKLALDYLRKAKIRRKALQILFDEKSYDDVIRESQEIVEISLKGILRAIGVEPPKKHDVGDILLKFKTRIPVSWQSKLPEIEKISKALFEERSHAFYGDESSSRSASEIYGRGDAEQALQWTDEILIFFEEVMTFVQKEDKDVP